MNSNQNGFTLIELLISLVFISGLGWMFFRYVVQGPPFEDRGPYSSVVQPVAAQQFLS